ncbi:hypothetical protein HPP92_025801 [Vanilla planifolia]|uniref:non-specific serine/threonine protein kinase n=1 Tax=Vanilla planifolia TaxID=51239 RepID=A0A835PII2_VANPL|nr:hypothetical protein HPP92_025801 [Vanilla planifolia]
MTNVICQSLEFPEMPVVSTSARDLIKGLLVKEPEHRLGSAKGAAEIKHHPFFGGVNWALIRCTEPPEVPGRFELGGTLVSSKPKEWKSPELGKAMRASGDQDEIRECWVVTADWRCNWLHQLIVLEDPDDAVFY